jgi:hypothetical protein
MTYNEFIGPNFLSHVVLRVSPSDLPGVASPSTEIGYSLIFPRIIYGDNQSCITLSANPTYHDRSKHIDLRFHFLREKVHAKILKLQYTSTSTMWADILTKSLTKDKHHAYIQALTKPLLSM